MMKKRQQQQVFDDFSNLQIRFQKVQEKVNKIMKQNSFKLDSLIQFLSEINRINQLKYFKQLLLDFEGVSATFSSRFQVHKKQE